MITAGKAIANVLAKLEPVREYFDQRADAEYFPDQPTPKGNEEMRLLVDVQDCICELESAAEDLKVRG